MATVDPKLLDNINALSEEVFALSTWLTDHPEESGEERESCAKIVEFLRAHGYEVETPYGGIDHSFRARPAGVPDDGRPKIAILCEYDALPDMGHACGHSVSCGISILTALALDAAYPDRPLRLDLVGTPGEEAVGGKVIMAEHHAFDEYDLAIMSHLDNDSCPQARLLASNDMYITFTGKPAHASGNPWDGVNAYNAAQLFSHASDMLRQHITPDCQLHGIITHGGSAPNIVPDRVELDYYLRSETLKGLDDLREKLTNCVRGAAIATGCDYTIQQRYGTYGDLCYPQSAVDELVSLYDHFGMSYYICEKPEGSSDVGNVDKTVPTLSLYIKGTDHYIVFHTPELVDQLRGERGMKTLLDGTNIQASFLRELAFDPEKLARIKEEHRAYRAKQQPSHAG